MLCDSLQLWTRVRNTLPYSGLSAVGPVFPSSWFAFLFVQILPMKVDDEIKLGKTESMIT